MKPKYKLKHIYRAMGSLHVARVAVSEGSFDDAFSEPFDKEKFDELCVENMKDLIATSVKYLTDEENSKVNDDVTKHVVVILEQMGMKMGKDMFNMDTVEKVRKEVRERELKKSSGTETSEDT